MIRNSMPSGLTRGWIPVFPRDKREAFARRSCANKKIEQDDYSKKSHPVLADARRKLALVPEQPAEHATRSMLLLRRRWRLSLLLELRLRRRTRRRLLW